MNMYFLSLLVVIQIINILTIPGFSQDTDTRTIRLMFYNVENLFDTDHDSLKDDVEFLPDGVRQWSQSRYNRKISSLYKTIAAAGEWNMPGIVVMCEVENRKVLEYLVHGTYLSKYDYGIVHEESPDPRGIDVCMIYRRDCAELLNYRYLIPGNPGRGNFHTRSVLYASLLIGSDTLHLIANHWPSRRGGALAGEGMRIKIAEMVKDLCDSIGQAARGGAKIIIGGDFNCDPDDVEIRALLDHGNTGFPLINLTGDLAERGEGTYRYKGIWEMIDQVMVSEPLLNSDAGLYTGQGFVNVFRPGFLLAKDPVYPGSSPFSTYRGYRYQGGFSDHLPVLTDLFVK
jgi:hypothetical protein